ncbi:Tfb4-domain-containing protein [Sodiomyces alkalinus F11]|uniref:General transcription and DNA repair factor IIH subunit TFB4 n=1 Tax=Sodiomyces alkalinus (strain CBS 110278 / VKM F-3762 / F11) TaxID=1314773 RepID=A0A3N2Q9Z3_SODAK|nr:Tfb4-domain-containing protein [Sodiomyces alkalinus F11]ROT43583.1 Tfb4-domain-containing protein [Sodiomyces alkalinus F11]
MNEVDASEHYQGATSTAGDTTSLCTVIIDTNPRAWAAMNDVLPLHKAVSNILIFLNANLAFNNSNQVAVIASHTNRAVWLYPSRPDPPRPSHDGGSTEDIDMTDAPPASTVPTRATSSANKYPQFAQIETAVLASLKKLLDETTEPDLSCTTSQLSGALTLALAHINKTSLALAANSLSDKANSVPGAAAASFSSSTIAPGMSAHILVLSVSDAEPSQYIPTMNAVFAAAHAQIPIDVIALSPASVRSSNNNNNNNNNTSPPDGPDSRPPRPGSHAANHSASATSSFLQQAAHITNGIFLCPSTPRGLLSYLTFGLACADKTARAALVPPTHHSVDFRAACFCHGRVVDTGFVCSVCLSIFCSVPTLASGDNSTANTPTTTTTTNTATTSHTAPVECLTCGTRLALGSYGARPAVVPRRRKKKKQRVLPNGSVREETGSATATPAR